MIEFLNSNEVACLLGIGLLVFAAYLIWGFNRGTQSDYYRPHAVMRGPGIIEVSGSHTKVREIIQQLAKVSLFKQSGGVLIVFLESKNVETTKHFVRIINEAANNGDFDPEE